MEVALYGTRQSYSAVSREPRGEALLGISSSIPGCFGNDIGFAKRLDRMTKIPNRENGVEDVNHLELSDF